MSFGPVCCLLESVCVHLNDQRAPMRHTFKCIIYIYVSHGVEICIVEVYSFMSLNWCFVDLQRQNYHHHHLDDNFHHYHRHLISWCALKHRFAQKKATTLPIWKKGKGVHSIQVIPIYNYIRLTVQTFWFVVFLPVFIFRGKVMCHHHSPPK